MDKLCSVRSPAKGLMPEVTALNLAKTQRTQADQYGISCADFVPS
ncbi:MAG: hypothetical protein ACLU3R_03655 [Acutalibacteraceae bacterium]